MTERLLMVCVCVWEREKEGRKVGIREWRMKERRKEMMREKEEGEVKRGGT